MIGQRTLIVFGKALTQMAELADDRRLSFNLSAHDIGSRDTVRRLAAMVIGSGVDPSRITFEITETAAMRDLAVAVAAIETFRARASVSPSMMSARVSPAYPFAPPSARLC